MTAPAIVLEQLSVRYAGTNHWVLRDVDVTVSVGETVLLLGASGSGKSTLALCLNGLIPHLVAAELQGEVRIAGQSTTAQSVGQLCQQVGLVFQDPEAQLVMPRVCEEVAFGLENMALAPEAMDGRIDTALAEVDLTAQRAAPVETLSGGQQQRLALAAVLATRPRILVLDEPTAHLDPAAAAAFYASLQARVAVPGFTTVLIEHQLDQVLPLVDRVIVLSAGGQVLAEGTPREVFGRQARTLARAGVWMPAVCQLATALRTHGVPVEGGWLSVEEAAATLRPLLGRRAAPAPGTPNVAAAPHRSSGEPPAVVVERVRFAYADAAPALQDVDLRVERGTVLALVGANGSGKTTLAKLLAGLIRPSSGSVRVLGIDPHTERRRQAVHPVGFVFQNPEHQFVAERVDDELRPSLPWQWDTQRIEHRVQDVLSTFGLQGYEAMHPFALSQGQKRRLSIATMVALDPPVLILDEPTVGQDRASTDALLALLRSLQAQGSTLIICTHDLQFVADVADELAILHAGRVWFHGPPGDLFAEPAVMWQAGVTRPLLAELGHRLGHPELQTLDAWLARLAP